MGVTFSTDSLIPNSIYYSTSVSNDSEYLSEEYYIKTLDGMTDMEARMRLRGSLARSRMLVDAFFTYQYSPIASFDEIKSLFLESIKVQHVELSIACWKIFGLKDNNCYVQEALICMVLLSEASWTERLEVIFEIFRCSGSEEILSEDIRMILNMAVVALGRLWGEDVPGTQLTALCTHLAESAMEQLEKTTGEGVLKEEFVQWSYGRFRESKTVANISTLLKIYGSASFAASD